MNNVAEQNPYAPPVAKSPFLVIPEFISPLQAEQIVDDIFGSTIPDYIDKDDKSIPIRTTRFDEKNEMMLFNYLQPHLEDIMEYYNIDYRGTEQMEFIWYPEGMDVTNAICENSEYTKKKWLKVRPRDLTCYLFLSDFNDNVPFDNDFEVFGSKLEFPQYNFSFNPQIGTMIVYPSGPHFINAIGAVYAGQGHAVKFHICSENAWQYNPAFFPGDFKTWFNETP